MLELYFTKEADVVFTSDHHFDHERVSQLTKRPFQSMTSMHQELIKGWNEVCTADTVVIHLGDFVWTKDLAVLGKLKFKKVHWLKGNHDPKTLIIRDKVSVYDPPMIHVRVEDELLVCCHYPIEDWYHRFKGSTHLHGHTHGYERVTAPGRLNMCVEAWQWRPARLSEVLELAQANRFGEETWQKPWADPKTCPWAETCPNAPRVIV